MRDVEAKTAQILRFPGLFLGCRRKMIVTDVVVFTEPKGRNSYYVCPRCRTTLEREFVSYCDRCGQRLEWSNCESGTVIYPQNPNQE